LTYVKIGLVGISANNPTTTLVARCGHPQKRQKGCQPFLEPIFILHIARCGHFVKIATQKDKVLPSFRRFLHLINADKIFGAHSAGAELEQSRQY
jgi:hypothetical protein